MKDEIVEEIRAVRRNIEEEFGNNPDKYMEHIYAAQKQAGSRLVSLCPKRVHKKSAP